MPRVKIDYIISFSSEDPENPAGNLLRRDVSNHKWLCARGQRECSVVLQLARAVTVSAVEVGAYNAAMVEVVAGRSEAAGEPYAALVPRSVFLSPGDSRRGERVARVRSFSGAQLGPAAARRADRLRVLCLQPYARDAQFGLSFIHVFEPESRPPPPAPAPARLSEATSDEERFTPGELFAAHRRSHASDAGAQIREASRALCAPDAQNARPRGATCDSPEGRAEDRVEDRAGNRMEDRAGDRGGNRTGDRVGDRAKDRVGDRAGDQPRVHAERPQTTPVEDTRKRKRPPLEDEPRAGAGARAAGVLAGVVFTLSGYVHPERGCVRAAAEALGARARRDWDAACTHLVCAFPDTPKLRAARSSGARVPVVRAAWVHACARARRRLPWRRYATLPQDRRGTDGDTQSSDSDTDDDIERVRARGASPAPVSRAGESATVASQSSTEEEEPQQHVQHTLAPRSLLPRVLRRVRVLPPLARAARHARALGATLVHESEEEEAEAEDGAEAVAVRGAWLWRCARAPMEPYRLPA